MRPKLKLAISDFHLGMGGLLPNGQRNYLEDFFHDRKFSEFCGYYCAREYEKADIELIICGDFFNHLQVDPMEVRPEFLTERVALSRTGAIIDGHPKVFTALRQFQAAPNHRITFLIGNHDFGLLWPRVQQFVIEKTGGRIEPKPHYIVDGIYFEHGSQHVAENCIDWEKPFVGDGEKVVNLPWGDLFVIRFLNRVKRKRPYVDKVFPFKMYLKWSLIHDTRFALRTSLYGIIFFLKLLLRIGEYQRFSARQTFGILKEFSFPVRMHRQARQILRVHPECLAVVFGHGHRAVIKQFKDGRWYFNLGIWNEMISLDIGTMGRVLKLTFLEVRYDNDNVPRFKLNEWKGEYREIEEIVSS